MKRRAWVDKVGAKSSSSLVSTKNYGAVWERDEGICQYCGSPGETIDHIIPRTWRLDNSMENLVVACTPCNSKAGNKMFESFEAKRKHILWYRKLRFGPAWRPY